MKIIRSTHARAAALVAATAAVAALAALAAAAPAKAASPAKPSAAATAASRAAATDSKPIGYRIDADTAGVIEQVSNIYNTSIVSNDPNVFKAEYEAGFIQGRLQKDQIIPARDNTWDSAFLVDPTHSFPKQIPPSPTEIAQAQSVLKTNWEYTLRYMQTTADRRVARDLRRLMYRLVGIYHGATLKRPQAIPFNGRWLPHFGAANMTLGYETPRLTFMDLYWINGNADVMYLLPPAAATGTPAEKARIADGRPSSCSAFVLKTADDVLLTHNNWNSFLDQSQAQSFWINGTFLTQNLGAAGYLCSNVDFGYNGHGIMFNETTHRYAYDEPKAKSLWMFWRAGLAEEFATTIDDFFNLISLEASGTYMNGYMVANANTERIGCVEMSWDAFLFFKLPKDGTGNVIVRTKPKGLSVAYDQQLIQPAFVLGINFPAALYVRDQLQSVDNRPARRTQFLAQIGGVHDIATAKALVTYTDPTNPLSIYGRWDLGFGFTPAPKTVPDGSCDAKAISAKMVRATLGNGLKGVLDTKATKKAFWMKYGTPEFNGKPFIWSESRWPGQKLRGVPDVVAGDWRLLNLYIR